MSEFQAALSSTEEIIEEARNGRMFILVDAEDRENEGDLVIPAQMATPEAINFMATHGRGLICLSLPQERVDALGLKLMSTDNQSRHQTAFTVSIEAREGVSTGISAHDRARTISVAIDPSRGKDDIATPGHVFPLVAREGGVLIRAGHTEAAVDIARLAGLQPAGVICEIMKDDGTMARLPDLVSFAQLHGLKIGTIEGLIAYRLRNDHLVERVVESDFESVDGGAFRMIVYANTVQYAEHIALVKGDISGDAPVPVRVHKVNALDDLLHRSGGENEKFHAAMRQIGRLGRGVIVLVRDTRPTALSDLFRTGGTSESDTPLWRETGIGAQILLDLGVRRMIVLSNTSWRFIGLEGYGLEIVEHMAIEP